MLFTADPLRSTTGVFVLKTRYDQEPTADCDDIFKNSNREIGRMGCLDEPGACLISGESAEDPACTTQHRAENEGVACGRRERRSGEPSEQ